MPVRPHCQSGRGHNRCLEPEISPEDQPGLHSAQSSMAGGQKGCRFGRASLMGLERKTDGFEPNCHGFLEAIGPYPTWQGRLRQLVLLPESTKRAGSKAPRHEKSNSRAPPSFPLNGEK